MTFQWLSKNINKKIEKSSLANGAGPIGICYAQILISCNSFLGCTGQVMLLFVTDKASGLTTNSNSSAKVIYPDTSRMVVYDPRQKPGMLQFNDC